MSFWQPGGAAPGVGAAAGAGVGAGADREDSGKGGNVAVFSKWSHLPIGQQAQQLPISRHRGAILYELERYSTLVIVGETGSGKTTQILQYLYHAGWTAGGRAVVCTQPRRLAAVTVAKRVAMEMGVPLGREVGYQVRFDQAYDRERSAVKFCTDGMLMREMLLDPLLSTYSVVMLDEAHERTLFNDVLFGLLKKVMRKRKDLRVIVASATMDADEFKTFFETNKSDNASQDTAQIMTIQGRQHPVDILYLEKPAANYLQAAADTVLDIHNRESAGDILLFMPGLEEIEAVVDLIKDRVQHGRLRVCPLYAALPQAMQMEALQPLPRGVRKVIVATTIAETSLTIEGIKFVVDSCFVKMPFYDSRSGMEFLVVTNTSKASATQRAGRAGRICPGKCFRLLTESDYISKLASKTVPEMRRSDISWVVLQLKALGIHDVLHFDFLSPPTTEAMLRAMELLFSLGALDKASCLTKPLGENMAEFPVEPRLAKVLLASLQFGCSEEMLSIAAMLSVQHPFLSGRGSREKRQAVLEAMSDFASPEGDHLTLLNLFVGFEEAGWDLSWCEENCLEGRAMVRAREVRTQLRRYLVRFAAAGKGARLPSCAPGETSVAVRRCLVSGYFSHAARMGSDGRYRPLRADDAQVLALHPSSVLAKFGTPPEYVVFHEAVFTSQLFMRDVSAVSDKWLLELAPHYFQKSAAGRRS